MSPTMMVSMGSEAFAKIGVEKGEGEKAPGNAQANGVVHTKPCSHGSRIRGVKVRAGGVKNASMPRGASTHRRHADHSLIRLPSPTLDSGALLEVKRRATVHAAEAIEEKNAEHGGGAAVERAKTGSFAMLDGTRIEQRGSFAQRAASRPTAEEGDQPGHCEGDARGNQRLHHRRRAGMNEQKHSACEEGDDAEIVD